MKKRLDDWNQKDREMGRAIKHRHGEAGETRDAAVSLSSNGVGEGRALEADTGQAGVPRVQEQLDRGEAGGLFRADGRGSDHPIAGRNDGGSSRGDSGGAAGRDEDVGGEDSRGSESVDSGYIAGGSSNIRGDNDLEESITIGSRASSSIEAEGIAEGEGDVGQGGSQVVAGGAGRSDGRCDSASLEARVRAPGRADGEALAADGPDVEGSNKGVGGEEQSKRAELAIVAIVATRSIEGDEKMDATSCKVILSNTTSSSFALDVGPGTVLHPHQSIEVEPDVAQSKAVLRLVRKGMVRVLHKPAKEN